MMNITMKRIVGGVLCASLISGPIGSSAATTTEAERTVAQMIVPRAADFRVEFEQALRDPNALQQKVDTVVYDLEHLEEDFYRDMLNTSEAAFHGLTQQVVLEVHRRFRAAVALMVTLMIDRSLPLEAKKKHLATVVDAIGVTWFRVLREHHRDELNKAGEFNRTLVQRVLLEYAGDLTAPFVWIPSAKRREVDAEGREINPGPGPGVSMLVDGHRRDGLTLAMTQDLQEGLHAAMNALPPDDPVREFYIPTFWGEKTVPKAERLRSQRLSAERLTTATYFGLAIFGLLAPAVDIVGLVDGRSENSLFASSMIYTFIWTAAALSKAATTSTVTLTELRRLIRITQDPSVQPSRADYSRFWVRFTANIKYTVASCLARLLPARRPPPAPATPVSPPSN